jgi:hypothetical protein
VTPNVRHLRRGLWRHCRPRHEQPAWLRAALKQEAGAPMAARMAWGGIAAGPALEKCALFPRVEA